MNIARRKKFALLTTVLAIVLTPQSAQAGLVEINEPAEVGTCLYRNNTPPEDPNYFVGGCLVPFFAISGTGSAGAASCDMSALSISGTDSACAAPDGYVYLDRLYPVGTPMIRYYGVAVSGTGDASSDWVAISGSGDAYGGAFAISGFGTASAPTAVTPRYEVQDLTPGDMEDIAFEATMELVELGVITAEEAADMAADILQDFPEG